MEATSKLTSKGQVTIPKAVRDSLGLKEGDELIFRVEDNRREALHLRHAELRPIISPWGHRAGNPVSSPADEAFIRDAVGELLAD